MAKTCPGCGAPMEYDPSFDSLVCTSCGNIIDPKTLPDADSFYYDNDEASDAPKPIEETLSEFEELTGEMYDCNVYTCSQCGAEVVVSSTEISTRCVYCGSTSVVFNRISKEHRPDLIVPFKVTKEDALSKVKTMLDKGIFVPKRFKKLDLDCVRGIYIPYFTFDGVVTDTQQHRKDTSEKTYVYDCYIEYQNLLVEACQALDDRVTAMLEPYNVKEAVEFDTSYLMGFYSNIQDLLPRGAKGLAELKAKKILNANMMSMPPATRRKTIRNNTEYDLHQTAYVLLPAWFITYNDGGTPYTFLVNGQTGELVGTAPWNKAAMALAPTAACLGVVALMSVLYAKFVGPFFSHFFSDDVDVYLGQMDMMRIIMILAFILAAVALVFAIGKLVHVWKNLQLTRLLMTSTFSRRRQGGVK